MSNEHYDENNHLYLTHAPSLATYIGKTLASYVSGNRMPEISGDNRKRIPDHIRARYDRDCERLAEEVLRYIALLAAPASPLPGGGDEALTAELKVARGLLQRWRSDLPTEALEDLTDAFLARNGKGEG